MIKNILFIITLFLISACSNGPKEINYGNDNCDNCTMTITEKPYATEVVTDKGKVHKFDSTECMLSYINENADVTYDQLLTATMDNPGPLLDATQCTYLISSNLPSPMGANITAYSTQEFAEKAQAEYGGDIFSFNELRNIFKDNHTHAH
ncbi:MAG: nitrous oxide reductase accessory protein NosL [Weeksellaceae bacterium]